MKMYIVQLDKGCNSYIEPSLDKLFEAIKENFDSGENYTMTIEQIDMEIGEYNSLPEFTGP